jgi:hypothetical protein
MTLRMLCEAAELFAGAGTLANMPAGIGDGCRPKKPLPIVVLNGTADPLVPYGGGGVGFAGRRGIVWSAEGTAAFLAEVNGCDGPATRPLATGAPGAVAKVVLLDWSSCSFRRPVHALSRRGRWAPSVRPHRHFCRHPRARHAASLRGRGDAGAFRRHRPLGPIGRAVPRLRTPRQERADLPRLLGRYVARPRQMANASARRRGQCTRNSSPMRRSSAGVMSRLCATRTR